MQRSGIVAAINTGRAMVAIEKEGPQRYIYGPVTAMFRSVRARNFPTSDNSRVNPRNSVCGTK